MDTIKARPAVQRGLNVPAANPVLNHSGGWVGGGRLHARCAPAAHRSLAHPLLLPLHACAPDVWEALLRKSAERLQGIKPAPAAEE